MTIYFRIWYAFWQKKKNIKSEFQWHMHTACMHAIKQSSPNTVQIGSKIGSNLRWIKLSAWKCSHVHAGMQFWLKYLIWWNFFIKYFHLIFHLILTKINCITFKIRSKADFKIAKYLTADNSVFSYSNANDMRVIQDLNSFGEIIAHAHCSVDEKNVGCN